MLRWTSQLRWFPPAEVDRLAKVNLPADVVHPTEVDRLAKLDLPAEVVNPS